LSGVAAVAATSASCGFLDRGESVAVFALKLAPLTWIDDDGVNVNDDDDDDDVIGGVADDIVVESDNNDEGAFFDGSGRMVAESEEFFLEAGQEMVKGTVCDG